MSCGKCSKYWHFTTSKVASTSAVLRFTCTQRVKAQQTPLPSYANCINNTFTISMKLLILHFNNSLYKYVLIYSVLIELLLFLLFRINSFCIIFAHLKFLSSPLTPVSLFRNTFSNWLFCSLFLPTVVLIYLFSVLYANCFILKLF